MKTVTKIDKVQPLKTEKRYFVLQHIVVFLQILMLSWKALKHRRNIMNLTLLSTGTGSLLGFILMKVLPEQKQKNVLY